ncbi:RNA polymerase sigma factor (sigma-70 family) [Janthinobacterium sp. CG_23.3]|uniref:RNA polymerase factor sigma-70 n=1 Tax=unclassified Janthinobacterium TaxID=2610881 RepID=UPI00036AF181|nr:MULTISPECIES: RNA polymerase factor sigma-70 [unclassified Janthinobacterium]MEC5161345.1 RNA polymerase sigma factor (sigma-70 family) [Janthinobacterium sp. CG_S6]
MTTGSEIRQLFILSRAQLRDAAARILGCRQRAEDVVQDAYLKLADGIEELQILNPGAYLFQLVRNLAIDRHRRSAFELQVFAPEDDGLHVGSAAATPEANAIHTQHLVLVARALSGLPERTRAAFELHRLGGKTQREVAADLGISTTLVNFMIRDAMLCCRDALRAA